MATAKAQLSSLIHLGLGIESVLGTAVDATAWVPINPPKAADAPIWIPDQGMRGAPYTTYGQYLGPNQANFTADGFLYPASGGNWLAAILGTDTVSGGAAPYTHTFTVADVPPSYTLSYTYLGPAGVGRKWPGQRCKSLDLKFTPKAGLSYTADMIGFPTTTYTPESPTFETDPFFLGWEGAISFGGTADANLSSFGLKLTREGSEVLFSAADSQDPYDVFIGALKGMLDLQFYMIADTEYAYALTQSLEVVVITVTQPTTGYVLTLTMSGLQFTKPNIVTTGKYVTVTISGEAVFNSTDSGILQATLTNGVSTAYSTTAGS